MSCIWFALGVGCIKIFGGSTLAKTINYALNQISYMENCRKDSRCFISNNVAECAVEVTLWEERTDKMPPSATTLVVMMLKYYRVRKDDKMKNIWYDIFIAIVSGLFGAFLEQLFQS